MDGKVTVISPKPSPQTKEETETFEAMVDGQPFSLAISDRICHDTMSGMPHPKSVAISLGEWKQTGCGGDPAELLKGNWTIRSVNGEVGSPQSQPTLDLEGDGKLSGGGICNRFSGDYALNGEGLTIGGLGASMMACEQPLMDQERALFDALAKINRFEAEARDSLRLIGAEAIIELSRKSSAAP
jgi:heat shock protein HslJ